MSKELLWEFKALMQISYKNYIKIIKKAAPLSCLIYNLQ